MSTNLRVLTATGAELERHIPALAELRIRVFREFPYLYDGDADYEARYLQTYRDAEGSIVVLVLDGEQVVGASTALPMRAETDEVKAPFTAQGYDPSRIFYLGESVLLPEYRGRGLGVRFFAEREAHAGRLAQQGEHFDWFAFCAVQRSPDDPRRPADHVPLDRFWNHRGYQRHPELTTEFSWKELGEADETPKPMVFWLKPAAADRAAPNPR
jgi:GNAT superfamily N-acetyltransferase